MTLRPHLDKAGKFTVEQIPCPHFNQAAYLNTPRSAVLHTTEGGWTGSLAVFKQKFAPHFLLGFDAVEKKTRIAQLVQIGTIGAALETHNWLALVQVEVIGYSKEQLWMPDEETAEALASLMAVCEREYGIPLSHPWPDGVYGMARASDPHRNGGQFGTVAGWFGHGDIPSPDFHWDPGALAWSKIFTMAKVVELGEPVPSVPPPLTRPCATTSLDADLITAVKAADAATRAAIMQALA